MGVETIKDIKRFQPFVEWLKVEPGFWNLTWPDYRAMSNG